MIEAIIRVLEPDEGLVVQLLIKSGGSCKQRELGQMMGLSRVRVHRLVKSLQKRRIVTIKKVNGTNEVKLADWIISLKSSD